MIQSLPSKLTPMSLQVSVQAEQQAVSRGSLGSVKQVSHRQTPSFEPAKKPTILVQLFTMSPASTGHSHGPYLCPPTPCQLWQLPAPKVPAGALQAAASLGQ